MLRIIKRTKEDRQQEAQLKQLQSTASAIRENLDVLSKQILKSDISAEDYAELISIYDEWREGTWYKAGQVVRWKDKAYEVVAPEHYSVISQEPDVTPAVYKEFTPPEIGDQEIIEDWEAPLYAEVGYNTGDIVRYKGQLWISTMDKNPHEPGVYGWDIYED